jgi:YVTN family beta-propeller protein
LRSRKRETARARKATELSVHHDSPGCGTTGKRLAAVVALCGATAAARAESSIFVSNERGNDLHVLSAGTNAVVATIAVGKRPRGMAVSPDRKMVYVALGDDDAVAQVEVATRMLRRTIPVGRDPEQVALSPDGKILYVSNEATSSATAVDLATGRSLFVGAVGTEPEGVGVTPDGRKLYVTGESTDDVTVLDARSGEILRTLKVGARPRWVAFSPDGLRAYITGEVGGDVSVLDVTTDKLTARISIANGQTKPDGVVATGWSDGSPSAPVHGASPSLPMASGSTPPTGFPTTCRWSTARRTRRSPACRSERSPTACSTSPERAVRSALTDAFC